MKCQILFLGKIRKISPIVSAQRVVKVNELPPKGNHSSVETIIILHQPVKYCKTSRHLSHTL